MRIVSGRFRGKAIATPPGLNTRPTGDRARQAVFNILEHAAWSRPLEGARVMDVFAGSGALGFEAISRGAAFCLFVETDEAARGAIRDNIEAFGLFGAARVHRRDATDLGVRPGSAGPAFDLVFMDPPYAKGLGERALASLAGIRLAARRTEEAQTLLSAASRAAPEDDYVRDVVERAGLSPSEQRNRPARRASHVSRP